MFKLLFTNRKNIPSTTSNRTQNSFFVTFFLGLLIITALFPPIAFAQGDGPRSQALIPVGVNIFVPTWVHLTGNYTFAGNILLPGAEVRPDVFVFTYMRSFDVGGRYMHIYINPIFGHIEGEGTVTRGGQTRTFNVSESGFADPIVTFKLGLFGTAPLRLPEFAKTPQTLQLSALASCSIPIGEYDSDRFLNLGTNIWAIRLGAPFVAPLGNPRRPFLWEFVPSITFYEDNDDPSGAAELVEQDPLFAIETHLSHNFHPKFWASVDARYRYGAESTTDGVQDENEQNVFGAGFTVSYAFTSTFSMQVSYGNVLTESDGTELEMLRIKGVISF